ncbi:MAG: hypothetical protein ACYSSO_07365 [Planctomycetota bacterium]|jgi:hypothetical protein
MFRQIRRFKAVYQRLCVLLYEHEHDTKERLKFIEDVLVKNGLAKYYKLDINTDSLREDSPVLEEE